MCLTIIADWLPKTLFLEGNEQSNIIWVVGMPKI